MPRCSRCGKFRNKKDMEPDISKKTYHCRVCYTNRPSNQYTKNIKTTIVFKDHEVKEINNAFQKSDEKLISHFVKELALIGLNSYNKKYEI